MKQRHQHKDNNKKHFFLLDDILYCDCGFRMGSKHKTGKTSNGYDINTKMYYCVSRERKWRGEQGIKDCDNTKSLDVDKTDMEVINFVKEVYSNSNVLKEKFEKDVLSKKVESEKELNERIKSLEIKGRKKQKRIESTISNISDMEVELLQGRKDKRVVEKVISSLKKELELNELDYNQIKVDIETVLNEKEWVDWVSKFSKNISVMIDNKDSQRDFLKGLLNDITVHSVIEKNRDNDDKQLGHSLTYNFKMKIVNDKLLYKDKNNKSLGYEIIQGKNSHKTDVVDISLSRGHKKKNNKKVNNSFHFSNLLHSY